MTYTFGKPAKKKHPVRKAFLIAAVAGAALWGDYQYYTPESWKDSAGQKVEEVTGSGWLGEAFGKKAPPQETSIETPAGKLTLTKPPQGPGGP